MFISLCRCIACESTLSQQDKGAFPLCLLCISSLQDCPSLCPNCASPACLLNGGLSCSRPWIHRPQIHSYSARYLLFKNTYQVLKRWKSRRGLLFDRKVLISNDSLLETWRSFEAEAVVPIPQRFERAWKMRGSRSELIANWVGSQLKLPICSLLNVPTALTNQKRQAELNLQQRLQNSIRFIVPYPELSIPKRVILVDDFITTGHTLGQAALVLLNSGVEEIHAFGLGVRTPNFSSS